MCVEISCGEIIDMKKGTILADGTFFFKKISITERFYSIQAKYGMLSILCGNRQI